MLLNSGKIALMDLVNALTFPGSFELALFSNNYTVVPGTTLADLTPASGFADRPLAGATGGVITTGPRGQSTYMPTTHHNSSGGTVTVYGWYVYDTNHGTLWSAGNFSAPIAVAAGADLVLNPFAQDDTL